jgi:hypothetical protein
MNPQMQDQTSPVQQVYVQPQDQMYQQPVAYQTMDPNMQGQPIPAGQVPLGYYQNQPQILQVQTDALLLCQHCMQQVKPEFSTISKFSIYY